jgi:hypothetical protein
MFITLVPSTVAKGKKMIKSSMARSKAEQAPALTRLCFHNKWKQMHAVLQQGEHVTF